MTQDPALPADLDLVRLDRADSAKAEAVGRAREGAPEGTLVWVERPRWASGRHGHDWLLPPAPGLHAALVLRPGLPAAECAQLGPVAVVALGRAVGAVVQPMAELHYRWPNDVLLDGGKVAGVWLDAAGTSEQVEWLVISWALNLEEAPDQLGFRAASLARDGASGDPDHGEVLQAIARRLVTAIATWDEAGFEPLLQSWRGRLALGGDIRVLLADGEAVAGIAEAVADDGSLAVATAGGTREISLTDFFGPPGETT